MDTLGDRMKNNYENVSRYYLTRRTPVIIRVDGKAFHTFTASMEKPFCNYFIEAMTYTAQYMVSQIQGAKVAYVQSDEISILVTDYETLETDAWFGYNKSKMESISASMATVAFNKFYIDSNAMFDARSFNIPKEEVVNYFVWRGKDWERNSLSMLARYYYSAKELHGKNREAQHQMLYEKGVNWALLEDKLKNGTFIFPSLEHKFSKPNYESVNALIGGLI